MNIRLLYIVLAIQVFMGGALLYVGYASRENRRTAYLELTHRVTAGTATAAEFEKLQALLPADADKSVVRALFGLPLERRSSLDRKISIKAAPDGTPEVWLYYPITEEQLKNGARIDSAEVRQFKGDVQCFVIDFDAGGKAHAKLAAVNHPILSN